MLMENVAPTGIWRVSSAEEMLLAGREIGAMLRNGHVVLLQGEMGAGKTTLAKGIVSGFASIEPEEVSSPTFPIVHEYRSAHTVFHLDLYRLETVREVIAIGLEDLLDVVLEGEALMLVEWGERFESLWPAHCLRVRIAITAQGRELELGPIERS